MEGSTPLMSSPLAEDVDALSWGHVSHDFIIVSHNT
jgi:hypothetical protein